MAYYPVQVLQQHASDCSQVRNEPRCWVAPEERLGYSADVVRRDLSGRNDARAAHDWVVYRCADPDCTAELAMYVPYVESRLGLDGGTHVAAQPRPIPSALPGRVVR